MEDTRFRKLPCVGTPFTRRYMNHKGFVMRHRRVLLHLVSVVVQRLERAKNKLMHQLTFIRMNEFHNVALFNLDGCRGKSHIIRHTDFDRNGGMHLGTILSELGLDQSRSSLIAVIMIMGATSQTGRRHQEDIGEQSDFSKFH